MNGRAQQEEEEGNFLNSANGVRVHALELEMPEDDEEEILEEEIDSLLMETSGGAYAAAMNARNKMHHRRNIATRPSGENGSVFHIANRIQGLLRNRIGNEMSCRNAAFLGMLALCVIMFVASMTRDMEDDFLDFSDTTRKGPPHRPSLGGGNNPGHYRQPARPSVTPEKELLPKSNVGVAVVSISEQNTRNAAGHYLHDFLKSPYSSPYYKNNDNTTAMQLQEEFETKMKQTATKYGRWKSPEFPDTLQNPEFDYVPYRDMPDEEFPSYAWQLDAQYMTSFLTEATELVERVKEGIYTEYGYGRSTGEVSEKDLKERRERDFGVIVDDFVAVDGVAYDSESLGKKLPGVAYLNNEAWEALVRKLLHAIITQDEFYVTALGGPHTFFANNFFQTQVMQFNYIMEPVLDKLGVRLISRNMGMDASTTVSALGGADIYGEADILWYLADPRTESGRWTETEGQIDLLNKQMIMSGERVPILLTPSPVNLTKETDGRAWIGNVQPGASFCEATVMQSGKPLLPSVKACEYVLCAGKAAAAGECDKHTSICWVNRTDWNPDEQDANVGHYGEGYSGVQQHLAEGRKLAMLVLHALHEALSRWTEENEKRSQPLPAYMWHVGDMYKEFQETVRTLKMGACDKLLQKIDAQICHMEMHAFTEWTPRVNPSFKSIGTQVESSVANNHKTLEELYTGVNLLPREWKIPDDEVDVHMIAIASVESGMDVGGEPLTQDDMDDMHDANEYGFPYDNYGYGEDDDTTWVDDDWFDTGDGAYLFRIRKLSGDFSPARSLQGTSAVASSTWTIFNAPLGFCDGSAQSKCNRIVGNKCLLSNYNHYRGGIMGHADSGELKVSLPYVKEGVVLVRFDWQLEGGPRLANLPNDFIFEYSVDDKGTSLSVDEFRRLGVQLADDCYVYPLLIDKEMSRNESETKMIKLGMQIRSSTGGSAASLFLTHIYYA